MRGTMGRLEKNPIRVGDRFGSLTVVSLDVEPIPTRNGYSIKRCQCRCDCGAEVLVRQSSLKTGNTGSCGCQGSRVTIQQRMLRHGLTTNGNTSPEVAALYRAVQRCYNPNDKKYYRYGARGITVCAEWRNRPELFVQHIGPRPSSSHSLHRIDNDGHYEPGNVRWATSEEQARHRSSNRLITYNGETRCVREWEDVLGFNQGVLRARLHLGWSGDRLFSPQRFTKGRTV